MAYNNCLLWAAARFVKYGGYLGMRRSKHAALVPHFVWSSDLRKWYGFVPERPGEGWVVFFLMFCFKGRVMRERPKPLDTKLRKQ